MFVPCFAEATQRRSLAPLSAFAEAIAEAKASRRRSVFRQPADHGGFICLEFLVF